MLPDESQNTIQPPDNVPEFKVFPHLMLNFLDLKSLISLLNILRLPFYSIQWSNPLISKTTLNTGFTVLYLLNNKYSIKSTIFWDITPCGPLSVNRCFGGTYRLHLQGRKNKFSKKPAWMQVASLPWWWRWYVPSKRRLALNGLHGVISQKIVLFITTTVRSSNPTNILHFNRSSIMHFCD
jgi:hypothetical protein